MPASRRVVWITGASSGIGEALAYEFAKENHQLIISSRSVDRLEQVKQRCESLGSNCDIVPVDLAHAGSIEKAIKQVGSMISKVDILINNGGISQRSEAIDTSIEIDRQIMEINFFGAVQLTKGVLSGMIKNEGGHIVCISSIVGKFGFPLRSAYAASKFALHGYYESLRAELSHKHIHVTLICPGRIKTNISINALNGDGKKHGVMDPGQQNGMSAELCARKIIKAIKKRKKEVYIGGKEIRMIFLRKFFPGIFYNIVSKINTR